MTAVSPWVLTPSATMYAAVPYSSLDPSLPTHCQLTVDSLVFGGTQLTATDIVSLSGDSAIGDPSLTKHVPNEVKEKACAAIQRLLEVGVVFRSF